VPSNNAMNLTKVRDCKLRGLRRLSRCYPDVSTHSEAEDVTERFDPESAKRLFAQEIPREQLSLTPRREPPPPQVHTATAIALVHGGMPLVGGTLLYLGLRADAATQHLDPLTVDGFLFGTLLRWMPFEILLAAATCASAYLLRLGLRNMIRPMVGFLGVRTAVALAFGLWIASAVPLDVEMTPAALWRALFCLPGVVGALAWGAPAYIALRLLHNPAAQAWANGPRAQHASGAG
jgi:hypothetical protein